MGQYLEQFTQYQIPGEMIAIEEIEEMVRIEEIEEIE